MLQQLGSIRAPQVLTPQREVSRPVFETQETEPSQPTDGFAPSGELADEQLSAAAVAAQGRPPQVQQLAPDQQVQGVGATEQSQGINSISGRMRETNRQDAIRRQVSQAPDNVDRPNGAANVNALQETKPVEQLNLVKETGTSETQMGDRRQPRTPNRMDFLDNLKATFAVN